ncbi:MAG: polysaccharide deacetylase family protein, partial [Streptosporangiaceae bacterium]
SMAPRLLASPAASAGRVIRRLMRHSPWGVPLAAAVLLAVGALVASGPLPAASAATQPVPPGLGGQNWTAVPTHAKVVALTFDAGANADGVQSILATLAKYHVPATFFLTGNFVRDFPAQAKAIAAAGQRIGDHSVSHPYFTTLRPAVRGERLTTADAALTQRFRAEHQLIRADIEQLRIAADALTTDPLAAPAAMAPARGRPRYVRNRPWVDLGLPGSVVGGEQVERVRLVFLGWCPGGRAP